MAEPNPYNYQPFPDPEVARLHRELADTRHSLNLAAVQNEKLQREVIATKSLVSTAAGAATKIVREAFIKDIQRLFDVLTEARVALEPDSWFEIGDDDALRADVEALVAKIDIALRHGAAHVGTPTSTKGPTS